MLTKLTLSVKAFTTGPKPAKAGKKFVASLAANENDTNGPVEAGTVACSATVGGKHLAATAHRVSNGDRELRLVGAARRDRNTPRLRLARRFRESTVVRTFAVRVTRASS